MRQWKKMGFNIVLVLVMTLGFLVLQIVVDSVPAQAGLYGDGDAVPTLQPTAEPSPVPDRTPQPEPEPTAEPVPAPTAEPGQQPEPESTPRPVKTPHPKALKKVKGVKLSRYATGAVKVSWKKVSSKKVSSKKQEKDGYYRVYYSKKKTGTFRCAGVTKENHYLVKKLKNNTTYYFYVQACQKKKKSDTDSAPSAKVHIKTKTYSRKTVFAGDSICAAIGYPGWAYPYMHIGGKKKVVAAIGLNTVTFHTKRVFKGRTGLQKLIAEKPYRAYMMLGMNEIHYRRISDMIAEYQGLIQSIRQSSPETDIVLCAVSPVTRAEQARHSGYRQIPIFNKKLKKLAKKMGVRYFDYTGFLKDSGGYLKESYAEKDGYHWKMSVYPLFAKTVAKYDKSLDQ